MDRIKAWLKFAGKTEGKVAAVFGVSPDACDRGVRYLSQGLPGIPIWLFTNHQPRPETARLCARTFVDSDTMSLLVTAEKQLWPNWVVLTLATWTGERGSWPIKLAPFLIPPFRALLMNERPDFFPPTLIKTHAARRLRDAAISIGNRARDIHRGLWLFLLSQIAQWSAPISRKVFQKRHGHSPLNLLAPNRDREGAVACTLHYKSRHWNHSELTRQLTNSTAPYALLHQHSATDNLHDALPLFDLPDTFAVSRQPAYRLWHPTIVPTAPFRQLQPGAAAATLAPISPSILFDRAKLLALGGLPDTVVPGSALLLLFWKAAAAGWTSYSAGGSAPLDEISDWPYEEAEFAVRVLSDPALKPLGPLHPHLTRGNISFQIGARPTYTPGRLRILVVSPYLPYPLSHGGAVRIYNLCRALSTHADLLLATFRESTDHIHFDKLRGVFQEVYVVDIDEKRSLDQSLPAQVRGHVSAGMRGLIAHLCQTRRIDLLQIEFTHLAAFRDAAPNVPAILVEHDLTFTLYRQLAEREATPQAQTEYERWLAFERKALRTYNAVWTMSARDRDLALEEGSPQDATYVVPNGVDIDRFRPIHADTAAPEIFYVGSFRHLPNILGFERLRHEIMPAVWARFPQAVLRVVAGPDPQRYWTEFQRSEYPAPDPRIHMHAFVEDLRPLYAKAQVVVTPLVVSAGTNIKVLEAMACQKAVVSTPIGVAGLDLTDGRDVVIREDSAAFAAAIVDLLSRPDARAAIAAAARRTVEERFSWEAIALEALASYTQLAGARR